MRIMKLKFIRRVCVLLALLAPAVYLFGSQFFALAGAHGAEVFAEPVYTEQYVEVDTLVDDGGDYRFTVSTSEYQDWCLFMFAKGNVTLRSEFDMNGVHYYGFNIVGLASYPSSKYLNFVTSPVGESLTITTLCSYDGTTWSPRQVRPWVFDDLDFSFSYFVGSSGLLEKSVMVPTSEVPENAGAYSDYVFKNFFAKDNFLVEWGENAISETPSGFAPFGYFWRYLDSNMLHLSGDQMGLMAYGYMYYAAHVLLFDLGFICVTFFFGFIDRCLNLFLKEES